MHNNKNLSEAVKLPHLNNSLTDNVKGVILCLTEGAGDYEKAIKLLSCRYGDPPNVMVAHLHRIIDWPNIATVKGFRCLQMHYRQLYLPWTSLGLPMS